MCLSELCAGEDVRKMFASRDKHVNDLKPPVQLLYPSDNFKNFSRVSSCDKWAARFDRDYHRIIGKQSLKKMMIDIKNLETRVLKRMLRDSKYLRAEDKSEFKKIWVLIHARSHSYDNETRQLESRLYQTGLLKMMRRLEKESERYFFWNKYLARFSDHLAPSRTLRPAEVTAENPAAHSRLPAEIMMMIYDCADLETCVNLREASSAWYSLFHKLNFKPKMRSRNPWIVPQDDLNSWADCVLVFVARLKTWKSVASIEDIRVPEKLETRNTVVAFEMAQDEKLTDNFSGMMGWAGNHRCEHLQVGTHEGNRMFLRDPWTHEVTRGYFGANGTYVEDGKTLVLTTQKGGVVVSVPPFIKLDDFVDYTPISVFESFVMLHLNDDRTYVVPREGPRGSSKNGFMIKGNQLGLSELGGGIIVDTTPGDEWTQRYKLLDPETLTTKEYAHITDRRTCGLVASYNGLMWWSRDLGKEEHKLLIPTFIDLASPEKVYYRADRILTGLPYGRLDQCSRPRGMAQYVVTDSSPINGDSAGLEIVDLATGVITDVEAPCDWRNQDNYVFAGFVKDPEDDKSVPKFQARVMTEKDVNDVYRNLLKKFEVTAV